MKLQSPTDSKLLIGGVKGLKDNWHLSVIYFEYKYLRTNNRRIIDSRSKISGN